MTNLEYSGANTVLVDMDGVLADFEEPNNDIIREHFPDFTMVTDRQEFYYADTYGNSPEVLAKIYKENRRPGFIRGFPLVEGAIDGYRRILEAGFTPRVCSSPLEDHATVVAEKIDWLEEYFVPVFGSWVIDTAIFNRDKSGYDASSMIDDRPTLRGIEKAVWQHIVFSRSYNKSVKSAYRLAGWHDPALPTLLVRARDRYRAGAGQHGRSSF